MDILSDGEHQYPANESGMWDFAVWHVGTDRFTVHCTDGVKRVTLNGISRAYADTAASDYGQVVNVVESLDVSPRDRGDR